jgi:hypothetical protein
MKELQQRFWHDVTDYHTPQQSDEDPEE